ncbi:MAG: YicC/YloC family endoribonuclease [Myxococcota bacterium]
MTRSMTGFGRAAFEVEARRFEIEARSVNHRHLDLRVRLPHSLQELEPSARTLCQDRLVRGKVDVNVVSSDTGSGEAMLEVDAGLAAQYVSAAQQIAETHGLSAEIDISRLLAMPGVARQVDAKLTTEGVEDALCEGIKEALDDLRAMQEDEGRKLEEEFGRALDHLVELLDWLEARAGEVFEASRERLHQRMEQIQAETGLLDSARLHQEVVILADRLDITEELVRLRSHVDQFRSVMDGSQLQDAVGRRLDFLLQEMGRETNTVGSKANDAPMSHQVVEFKIQLEKIREQVQNVA